MNELVLLEAYGFSERRIIRALVRVPTEAGARSPLAYAGFKSLVGPCAGTLMAPTPVSNPKKAVCEAAPFYQRFDAQRVEMTMATPRSAKILADTHLEEPARSRRSARAIAIREDGKKTVAKTAESLLTARRSSGSCSTIRLVPEG